jgi:hypothetical protein
MLQGLQDATALMDSKLSELEEALTPREAQPPVCPVCDQRAWPGDEARHIASLHRPAPEERDAA